MFLQTDILMVSNVLNTADGTAIPELFKSSIAFRDRFGKEPELISKNNDRIYIYLHLCNRPLQPAPLIQLNHFCGLQKRPRKIDDFNVPVNTDNTFAVYIVNNRVDDLYINESPKKDVLQDQDLLDQEKKRKKKNAERIAKSRSNETPEQRKKRLKQVAERVNKIRSQESAEEKTKRLQLDAERVKKSRSQESTEEKD